MTEENKASFEREIKLEQQLADMTKDRNWHKQAYQGLVNGLADTASLQATIAQLQATLAAREARIVILEEYQKRCEGIEGNLAKCIDENELLQATIKGYRHSIKIIGQQHDDRKAEHDAAVQEAGRLKEECAKIAERNTYMSPNSDDGGYHGGPGSCEYGCGSVIAKTIRELK